MACLKKLTDTSRLSLRADLFIFSPMLCPISLFALLMQITICWGNPTVSYVYGLDLISQTAGGTTHYYHYDGQGSTRMLTNASGSITDGFAYDAFGIEIDRMGTTSPVHYRYTGEHWDADLQLVYLRARWYAPEFGRFMSRDPFEGIQANPLTLHPYLYATNNPVMNVDPSGESSLASVSFASAIGNSLHGTYDSTAIAVGQALQATIFGVEVGKSTEEVLVDYLTDVATGVAIGAGIGIVVSKISNIANGTISKIAGNRKGYISGYNTIRSKLRTGSAAELAEIRAAKAFREQGYNVHFRRTASEQGFDNVRTSDFFVGGERGNGIGGIKYKVYSPETTNIDSIVRTVGRKLGQADRMVIDLSRNGLSPSDLGNLIRRVNNVPGRTQKLREVLFLRGDQFIGQLSN